MHTLAAISSFSSMLGGTFKGVGDGHGEGFKNHSERVRILAVCLSCTCGRKVSDFVFSAYRFTALRSSGSSPRSEIGDAAYKTKELTLKPEQNENKLAGKKYYRCLPNF